MQAAAYGECHTYKHTYIATASYPTEVKDYDSERQTKQWLSNQITYSMSGMVMW